VPEFPRQIRLPTGEIVAIFTDEIDTGTGELEKIPVLPVDKMTFENYEYLLSQVYGELAPEEVELYFSQAYYSALVHDVAEPRGITPEMIEGNDNLQQHLLNWGTQKASGREVDDTKQLSSFLRMAAPEAPGTTYAEGRPPPPGMDDGKWIPHMTRMPEISEMAGRDARELYAEDIEKMKRAADTGQSVELTMGMYDPMSSGFEPKGALPEEEEYYKGDTGLTINIPNPIEWSRNTFLRYKGGWGERKPSRGVPMTTKEYEAMTPREKEGVTYLPGAGKTFPKGMIRMTESERSEFLGEGPKFKGMQWAKKTAEQMPGVEPKTYTGQIVGKAFLESTSGGDWTRQAGLERQEEKARRKWEELVRRSQSGKGKVAGI